MSAVSVVSAIACKLPTAKRTRIVRKVSITGGFELKVVNPADAKFFVSEIYENNSYSQNGIEIQHGDLVMDIGANIGVFSTFVMDQTDGDCDIISVEPVQNTFHKLCKNMVNFSRFKLKNQREIVEVIVDENLESYLQYSKNGNVLQQFEIEEKKIHPNNNQKIFEEMDFNGVSSRKKFTLKAENINWLKTIGISNTQTINIDQSGNERKQFEITPQISTFQVDKFDRKNIDTSNNNEIINSDFSSNESNNYENNTIVQNQNGVNADQNKILDKITRTENMNEKKFSQNDQNLLYQKELGGNSFVNFTITSKFRKNSVDNIFKNNRYILVNAAVSDSDGETTISSYEGSAGSSTLYFDKLETQNNLVKFIFNNLPFLQFLLKIKIIEQILNFIVKNAVQLFLGAVKNQTCKKVTVSTLIKEFKIVKIDLLKVDVERAELDVLKGIKNKDWCKIKQVVLEVHDIDNRLQQIVDVLKQHNFASVICSQDEKLQGTNLYMVYGSSK